MSGGDPANHNEVSIEDLLWPFTHTANHSELDVDQLRALTKPHNRNQLVAGRT